MKIYARKTLGGKGFSKTAGRKIPKIGECLLSVRQQEIRFLQENKHSILSDILPKVLSDGVDTLAESGSTLHRSAKRYTPEKREKSTTQQASHSTGELLQMRQDSERLRCAKLVQHAEAH